MVAVNLWSGLMHRLFPWRATSPTERPRRASRRSRRARPQDSGAAIRLARKNAYTGLARFTGRSVDRLFLGAMSRPHRYPGPGDLERVGEEILAAHALYREGRPPEEGPVGREIGQHGGPGNGAYKNDDSKHSQTGSRRCVGHNFHGQIVDHNDSSGDGCM